MANKDPHLAFVVAHFHANGKVPIDLFHLIKYVSTLTNNIVFVSTNISEHEITRISPYAKVISRENYGYDFWSYKLGLDALGDLSGYQRIVFFNSSFITLDPQRLCEKFLKPVTAPQLRGLTYSNQRVPHVQSYWFAFEHAELINSDIFKRWWAEMVPLSSRDEVITYYELGMSDWFARHGVKIDVVFRLTFYDRLKATVSFLRRLKHDVSFRDKFFKLSSWITLLKIPFVFFYLSLHLNPTHHAWKSVYRQLRILKIELLKFNPTRQSLDGLFRKASPETLAMIKDAIEN